MSLLMKGMEMPRTCDVCKFQHRSYATFVKFCQFHNLDDKVYDIDERVKQRPQNCPLVEVPTPHGRLIDEDWLYRFISTNNSLGATHYGCLTKEEIQLAPTVIEREE